MIRKDNEAFWSFSIFSLNSFKNTASFIGLSYILMTVCISVFGEDFFESIMLSPENNEVVNAWIGDNFWYISAGIVILFAFMYKHWRENFHKLGGGGK